MFPPTTTTASHCTVYYERVKADFEALVRERFAGLAPDEVRAVYREVDGRITEDRGGHEWEWFPRSLPATYLEICDRAGGKADPERLSRAGRLGLAIPSAPYEPFEGALATLRAYREAGLPSVLPPTSRRSLARGSP